MPGLSDGLQADRVCRMGRPGKGRIAIAVAPDGPAGQTGYRNLI